MNPIPALSQLQQLPGSAEPGRQAPRPPDLPPGLSDLQWSVQLPPGAEPPPSLKAETLTLKDIRLIGVTAYSRAQLAGLFENDLGKTITFERFYAIARAIQQRYREDGYILCFSYVPPQTVEDGIFTIAVVSDTGCGIPEDKMEVILQPFGQADMTLQRNYEGTGLGLPLVNAMTELHGGKLEIFSREGRGTTATVRLPADRIIETDEKIAS